LGGALFQKKKRRGGKGAGFLQKLLSAGKGTTRPTDTDRVSGWDRRNIGKDGRNGAKVGGTAQDPPFQSPQSKEALCGGVKKLYVKGKLEGGECRR